MGELEKLKRILRGSTQYKLIEGVLTVTGYYTGEEVRIDLNKLDEEMLDDLQPEEEDPEE